MGITNCFQPLTAIRCVFELLLSCVLLATPTAVLAHGGHKDEFHGATTPAASSIQVDAEIAKQLGIEIESVKQQRLATGIKTTGQIEILPNKKVEVTAPISRATVVELLVEPGTVVKAGQPVAVVTAPDLVELRVNSQEKRAAAQAEMQQAQADLKLAQQNLERQRQITAANIAQARTEVEVAQEQYDKDMDLVKSGALPRRNMLESKAHLDEGKAQLTTAATHREVLEAEAQLTRAQSAVQVAQSRLRLSDDTYQTRLQQLGTKANAKGLITVTAPIAGRVADREVTLGQSFEDAGGKLMTIVDDSRVFATANIHEKDLDKVKTGQGVNVKVANLSNRNFSGRIAVIGAVVESQTRIVPVKAELDNSSRALKPGMFAELEVLTDQTPAAMTTIPTNAIVEANGKKLVYVQNGNAYQSVDVTLGQTSGNLVEVKSGLFAGDQVVTQGAMQLYAQSLRGGSNAQAEEAHKEATVPSPATNVSQSSFRLPWWWVIPAGGMLTAAFWAGRRTKPQQAIASTKLTYVSEDSPISTPTSPLAAESPSFKDNHHLKRN